MSVMPTSICLVENFLVRGDPLDPCITDLIAQTGRLPVGMPVPEGWRILDGNAQDSLVARVVMRHEVEDED